MFKECIVYLFNNTCPCLRGVTYLVPYFGSDEEVRFFDPLLDILIFGEYMYNNGPVVLDMSE